jgi:NADH dehydrogenase [ubiquinone] 1 alpha subcomplex assembly factor 5
MVSDLFDMHARLLRRDRAARRPVSFLLEREFDDILERLSCISRRFRSALLLGVPDPSWTRRLASVADQVIAVDPGAEFATAAGGTRSLEESLDFEPARFDLCVAAGTLDTVNALPDVLLRLRFLLAPDSFLIGVMSGGNTLPRLRQAMRAADGAMGAASPHVHPRVEPAALAQLLTAAGFAMPVVDVERVRVSYREFRQLVGDLRGMAATNILTARSRKPLTRAALCAAEAEFEAAATESRITELFELLHFAAWTPTQAIQPVNG